MVYLSNFMIEINKSMFLEIKFVLMIVVVNFFVCIDVNCVLMIFFVFKIKKIYFI